jgi:hypothetical protein
MGRIARTFACALATLFLASQAGAQPAPKNPLAPPPAAIIYLAEQIVTGPLAPETLERVKPLNTLQQVEDLLKAGGIPFGWRRVELNTDTLPPALAQQIAALPPREVFVIPQSGGKAWVFNVVIARR